MPTIKKQKRDAKLISLATDKNARETKQATTTPGRQAPPSSGFSPGIKLGDAKNPVSGGVYLQTEPGRAKSLVAPKNIFPSAPTLGGHATYNVADFDFKSLEPSTADFGRYSQIQQELKIAQTDANSARTILSKRPNDSDFQRKLNEANERIKNYNEQITPFREQFGGMNIEQTTALKMLDEKSRLQKEVQSLSGADAELAKVQKYIAELKSGPSSNIGKGTATQLGRAESAIALRNSKQKRIEEIDSLLAGGNLELPGEEIHRRTEFNTALGKLTAPTEEKIRVLQARNNKLSAHSAKGNSLNEINEIIKNNGEIERLEKLVEEQRSGVSLENFKVGQENADFAREVVRPLEDGISRATARINELKSNTNRTEAENQELQQNEENLEKFERIRDRQNEIAKNRGIFVNQLSFFEEGTPQHSVASKKLAEFDKEQSEINQSWLDIDTEYNEALRKINGEASIDASNTLRSRLSRIKFGTPATRAILAGKAESEVESQKTEAIFEAQQELDDRRKEAEDSLESRQENLYDKVTNYDFSADTKKLRLQQEEEVLQDRILDIQRDNPEVDIRTARIMAEKAIANLADGDFQNYATAQKLLASDEYKSIPLGQQYGKLQQALGTDGAQTHDIFKRFYSPDVAGEAQEQHVSALGLKGGDVDGILASDAEDAEKFEAYYQNVGKNVQKAFDGIKERVGDAKAKQMKQAFLTERGWDEDSVQVDDFTDDISSLYKGEAQGMFEVPALVKKMKSAGMPEEYIASQLKTIAESDSANPMAVSMANALMSDFTPEADIRGGVKEGFVQIVTNDDGSVEVKRLSGKSAPTSSFQTSTGSRGTAKAFASTYAKEQPESFAPVEGLTLNNFFDQMSDRDYLDQNKVGTLLSQIDPDAVRIARQVLDPRSGATIKDLTGGSKDEIAKRRQADLAYTILSNQLFQRSKAEDKFEIILEATSGARQLTQGEAEPLTDSLLALEMLSDLDSMFKKRDGKKFIDNVIAGSNPFDAGGREINAQLQAIVPKIARGVFGEVGVLTDTDIANYKKVLPNLRDTDPVKKALMSSILRTVQRSYETRLEGLASAKRDVSGYSDQYIRIKNRADQLMREAMDEQNVELEKTAEPTQETVSAPTEQTRNYAQLYVQFLDKDPQIQAMKKAGLWTTEMEDKYFAEGYQNDVSLESFNFE